MSTSRLLVVSTGCANVTSLPSYLVALTSVPDLSVRLMLTRTAAGFFPVAAARMFCADVVGPDDHVNHVAMTRDCDQVAVVPASARFLASLATGLYDSPASLVVAAAGCPVHLFPSMNATMWRRSAVARNVDTLVDDGYLVSGPVPDRCWEAASHQWIDSPGLCTPRQVVEVITTGTTHHPPRGVRLVAET